MKRLIPVTCVYICSLGEMIMAGTGQVQSIIVINNVVVVDRGESVV